MFLKDSFFFSTSNCDVRSVTIILEGPTRNNLHTLRYGQLVIPIFRQALIFKIINQPTSCHVRDVAEWQYRFSAVEQTPRSLAAILSGYEKYAFRFSAFNVTIRDSFKNPFISFERERILMSIWTF